MQSTAFMALRSIRQSLRCFKSEIFRESRAHKLEKTAPLPRFVIPNEERDLHKVDTRAVV